MYIYNKKFAVLNKCAKSESISGVRFLKYNITESQYCGFLTFLIGTKCTSKAIEHTYV